LRDDYDECEIILPKSRKEKKRKKKLKFCIKKRIRSKKNAVCLHNVMTIMTSFLLFLIYKILAPE